jgi:hypothetical protein
MQRSGFSIGTKRFLSLFVSTLSCLLVLGCTSTPKLKPAFQPVAEQEKIQKTIAVLYSPEFSDYKQMSDPYHNKADVEFLIGAASVGLFQNVFDQTFREVKGLNTQVQVEAGLQGVDTIIEPKIKSFNFYYRLAGHWDYWADITYEIDLASAGGGQRTAWCIRGTGESIADPLFDGDKSLAKPVELAMQDAASQLAVSFYETPEAMRWLRGLPEEGATAPEGNQTVWSAQDHSAESIESMWVGYEGVVSARAGLNVDSDPEVDKAQAKLRERGLVAVYLCLKNEGKHALGVRRSSISMVKPGREALGPMPCSFFAAAGTSSHVRLPNVAGGTGYAAIPQLLFSLANLAIINEEERESGYYSFIFEKYAFANVVLKEGDTAKGALFFSFAPGVLYTTNLILIVPVVDLDSAIRCVLRVPVE